MQKNITTIIFLVSILLLCIYVASWYRTKLQTIKSVVGHGLMILLVSFFWVTKPCPQKLADFVNCLTSTLYWIMYGRLLWFMEFVKIARN